MTADRPPQELAIPDALKLAAALHQDGKLRDAETLYRRVLKLEPDQPDALNFLGVLTFQQGDVDGGIQLIRQAIKNVPELPDPRNNLGNILRHTGDLQGASEQYRCAVSLDPNNVGSRYNYATLLSALGRPEEAVEQFRAVIALNPDHSEAYRRASRILYQCGKVAEAAEWYRQWLEHSPNHPIALHMLAACTGEAAPGRASDEYVQRIFDGFSQSFDRVLTGLDYQAPRLVAEAIAKALGPPQGNLEVLDAGCGTGLAAELLRPYARCLIGIDLSQGMLDKAKDRLIYDQLIQVELTRFVQEHVNRFDLIACVDTLCYFGDLGPVSQAVAGALRTDGCFAFTVEWAEPSPDGSTLNVHGRYSHTREYVINELTKAGLVIRSLEEETLRTENNQPVKGLVVCSGHSR